MESPKLPADCERELSELSSRLEDRRSIVHFALSFGLLCGSIIVAGVAAKLLHDSLRIPKIAFALAALAAGGGAAAVWQFFRGRGRLAAELSDFQRLLALRRELGLDRSDLPFDRTSA